MRSSDWQPIETAPLNPYGKPWGPPVLVWCSAIPAPICAYFDPWHDWKSRDCGPAWVVNDGVGDDPIAPEDVTAWMPIAVPGGEKGSAGIKQYLTAPEAPSAHWTDAMCRAFAYGYDGEDAHQRGESNPWLAGPKDDAEWEAARIACVRDGLKALALHLRQNEREETAVTCSRCDERTTAHMTPIAGERVCPLCVREIEDELEELARDAGAIG